MLTKIIESMYDYDKVAEEAVKDIHVTDAGTCMKASEEVTKAFLANDISDFKVIEGWVRLYDRAGRPTHTWLELDDGTVIDKTLYQFKEDDVSEEDLENIDYVVGKKYTPTEYLELCKEYPK